MEKTRNGAIDICRIIAAVFVIAIHAKVTECVPYFVKNFLDLVFSLAVPFFFMTTGYFMGGGVRQQNNGVSISLKRTIVLYVIWNLIYLPLSILGEVTYGNSFFKACFKLMRGWFFVGQNYYSWAFWYLLALIVAEAIIMILTKFRATLKIQIFLSSSLFFIGIVLDYLYNYTGIRNVIIDGYYDLFMTTRNGLFVGFFYVTIGMVVARIQNRINPKYWCAILLMSLLSGIFYSSDGILETSLTAITSISLFGLIIIAEVPEIENSKHIRDLATTVYLTHMLFVFIGKEILQINNQMALFVAVTMCSFMLSCGILKFQYRNHKLSKILHIN